MDEGIKTHGKTLRERFDEDKTVPQVVHAGEYEPVRTLKIPKSSKKVVEEVVEKAPAIAKDPIEQVDPDLCPSVEVTLTLKGAGLLVQQYHDVLFEGNLVIFVADTRWKWGTYYLPELNEEGTSEPFMCSIGDQRYVLQYFGMKFTDKSIWRTYVAMANVGPVDE